MAAKSTEKIRQQLKYKKKSNIRCRNENKNEMYAFVLKEDNKHANDKSGGAARD